MDFYKIFKTITNDERMAFGDILAMSVIATRAQFTEDHTVELSFKDIHNEFPRLYNKTIRRSIQRLAELHYIEIIKQAAPKPNKYKVLIDMPQVQPAPQIKQKKNSNKIQSEADYIAEAKRVMLANPFLKAGDDE